jgi:hypothetical protein
MKRPAAAPARLNITAAEPSTTRRQRTAAPRRTIMLAAVRRP